MSRTFVVFGAHNSVGALAARQYGNQGYDVVLVADHAHCVKALISVLESEDIATRTFTGDLSHPEQARAMIRSIRSSVGPIDAMYYGLDSSNGPHHVAEASELSLAAVVSELLPDMRSRKAGAILLDADAANLLCVHGVDAQYCLQCLEEARTCEGVQVGTLSVSALIGGQRAC
ncbi:MULTISPECIES: SDR family NAD(P)-dependent oxidoreductase [Pseudomonas]|uniref:Putative short chain alcohol dehydrogenase n=1 Tax=Pseudomonas fulva (strain 12-X) TaxID=743720 RepID=F6A8V7_PSEF1|nr:MULTISPECIES: SDR family NAD(P)-dependent oxidoreductase [Pseudomonas]AEF20785.1 putative short chain alcohol dehydrogenase [Pseudomonas fulva 12-X]MBV7565026.1 SDR family NAD(P)-dependent oxidoreductase [Pseudomonas sp. sia0905]